MTTKKAKTIKLAVIIRPGEDGFYVAEIPDLPGCISQGKTYEEAVANIKEAAQLCLDSQKEEGWTLPGENIVEQVEVNIN
jgi:predicted RNase H-like HicB family nuclease